VAIIFEIFWRSMEFDWSLVFCFEALVQALDVYPIAKLEDLRRPMSFRIDHPGKSAQVNRGL
jgi:hypothetical protein